MAFRPIKPQPPSEPPAPEHKPKSLGPMPPSPEELQNIFTTVLAENPWMANTDNNGSLVAKWVEENNGGRFSLESVRVAVQVLKNELEKAKPLAPLPSTPLEPPEVDYAAFSDTHELPIDTPSWRLKRATAAQLHSIVQRQDAAKRKR